jgi:hypothetical protein
MYLSGKNKALLKYYQDIYFLSKNKKPVSLLTVLTFNAIFSETIQKKCNFNFNFYTNR